MSRLSAFACGFVFAIGLGLAGMTRPSKVVGFLDVTGNWDPTLAFVMGGAVLVGLVAVPVVLRRGRPLFEGTFSLPSRKDVDLPLVAGSAIFGVGWGLAGWCPGPAIVSLATLSPTLLTFLVAMALGLLAGERVHRTIGEAQAAAALADEADTDG
ncbi:YeeE/YedE family protein [bacterium]|nr:YeeE/YedE family protein [bacterium]